MTVIVPGQAPYGAVLCGIICISKLYTVTLPPWHLLIRDSRNAARRIINAGIRGPAIDHFHTVAGLREIISIIQIMPGPASDQPDILPIKNPPAVAMLVLVGQLIFIAFPKMIGVVMGIAVLKQNIAC
jgi:hypothetical protein